MSRDPAATREAFAQLLAQPLLTAARHPDAYTLVQRNRTGISVSATKFGYQVRSVGNAVRIDRIPLAGTVSHPPRPIDAPSGRVLALACLIAAACEDSDGAVTLAWLSNAVAALSATPGLIVTRYDPDQFGHRRDLVRAVMILESHGVLLLRSGEAAISAWTESRSGAGAGYQVDRDALLLLTNPDVLSRAVAQVDADDWAMTRHTRLLRELLEAPALLYAGLADRDPDDAERARGMRGLLKHSVVDAVGGHVEDRSEGLVLVVGDPARPSPLGLDFPAARADSWVALLAADAAGQLALDGGTRDSAGRCHVRSADVDILLEELVEDRGEYLTVPLRESREHLRSTVERILQAVGLLHVDGGDWALSPVAGRYRAPEVVMTRFGQADPVQEELS